MSNTPDVLFTQAQIAGRIGELGAELNRTYAGREVAVVGLMKSCLVFMADLIRAVDLDTTCHFLRVTSQPDPGSVRVDIVYSTEVPYAGRDILLLEDVVDTGVTLSYLIEHIREHAPRSLKVLALVDKPDERKVDVHPDWAAFRVQGMADRFLVGYGLDHRERFRGLPYIGTIERS